MFNQKIKFCFLTVLFSDTPTIPEMVQLETANRVRADDRF